MSYATEEHHIQGAHAEMIDIRNDADHEGLPAGGHALGRGLAVQFQPGPVKETGAVVGAFVEDLLIVAAERLRWYQTGQFHCPENGTALAHVEAALQVLNARTEERRKRGVEGSHKR